MSEDCRGIVPDALGASVTAEVPHGSDMVCWSATSDGQGFVAAEVHADGVLTTSGWFVFDRSGTRSGVFGGNLTVAPQPRGFEASTITFRQSWETSGISFSLYDDAGGVSGEFAFANDACGTDGAFPVPGGGSIGVYTCGNGVGGSTRFQRFGADGNRTYTGGSPGIGLSNFQRGVNPAAAAGGGGRTLGLVTPGSVAKLGADDLAARWFAADGSAETDVFSAGKGSGDPILRTLADGSVAVQAGGNWVSVLAAGSASPKAVPDWLAEHDNFDLALVRSGRAYALIPRNGAADRKSIELYSIAGNRCGKITLSVGGLSVGFDGTVIASSGDGGCTKTWWSGLLK